MAFPRLGRRRVLRGLGGAMVPLPALEAMLDPRGVAWAAGPALPLRYLVCFGGFALRSDKDNGPDLCTPSVVGPGYDLKPALAPLAMNGNVSKNITVVSGLRIPVGGTPPAGGRSEAFHSAMPSPLFSGIRSQTARIAGRLNDTLAGPSSDQIVADAFTKQETTTFPSLSYRVQADIYWNFDSKYGGSILSWKGTAGGASPILPESSPRRAYDALFTGFSSSAGDPLMAGKLLELDKRKSVLDLVDRRMNGLALRLGTADKRRLTQHYDEIRQLETRLGAIPQMQAGNCKMLPDPGADTPTGAINVDTNYDVNNAYSGEDARARVFNDLVSMAFTCDRTRVGALMYTTLQSGLNLNPIVGFPHTIHDLNHNGTIAELAKMTAWHMKHFGYLVGKLRDTPEGAGSVLDRCAIVYLHEAGYGINGSSYHDDMTSHNSEYMMALVAGRAGGLKPGVHLVAPSTANHPANVLMTAMTAVGVPTSTLGEVTTGPISALVG